MSRPSRFSPEVKGRSVRLVVEQTASHGSQWAALQSVAEEIGCHPETLRGLVRRHECDTGRAARPDHGGGVAVVPPYWLEAGAAAQSRVGRPPLNLVVGQHTSPRVTCRQRP